MHRPLPQHLPALDGLRGVAALMVLVSHSANAGFLPTIFRAQFGPLGVALFYLLSGFLMTHLAVRSSLSRENLRNYAVARLARVLPLFYLALLVAAPASLFAEHWPYEIKSLESYWGNWLLLRGTGVLWSVPVEVHFYLLFPLLWWAHAREKFALVLGLGLAFCLLLALFGPVPKPVVFLPWWLHFFLIGAGLRWLADDGARSRIDWMPSGTTIRALAWASFAGLVVLPPDLRSGLGLPALVTRIDPVAWIFLPLVLWLCCAQVGPFRLFAAAPLRWFGAISYGLYLIHSPVISLVEKFRLGAAWGPAGQFLTVLVISTLLATAAFYLFERPVMRKLRARYDSPSIAAQP